jgi:hypothetical protein
MKIKDVFMAAEELYEMMVDGSIDYDDAISELIAQYPVLTVANAEEFFDAVPEFC